MGHQERAFSFPKICTAIGLGYACAAAWVIYADIVYHNNVPLDAFEFHGLYPISLGLSAAIAALMFDHNLKSLGFSKFHIRYFFLPPVLAALLLFIPFGVNVLTGMTGINPSPKLDMELVYIGLPVLIILAIGEEVMWRGILFTELSKKYTFITTSTITGILWAIWHYPVIIHTKFVYADRPLWFVLTAFTIAVISSSFMYNYIRKISNSIWPTILLHALMNYLAFVLIEPFESSVHAQSMYFINDIGIFYVAATMIGAVWVLWRIKHRHDH